MKVCPFSDDYELKEEIGVGSFAICKRCVNRKDGRSYAVKVCASALLLTLEKMLLADWDKLYMDNS